MRRGVSEAQLEVEAVRKTSSVLEPIPMVVNVVLFVLIVLLIALPYGHSSYVLNTAMKTLVNVEAQPDQTGFVDIETTSDFYTWVRDKAVANLFLHTEQSLSALGPSFVPSESPALTLENRGNKTHFFPYGRTYLLGPVRLRQIRAAGSPCSFNAIHFVELKCHSSYSHAPYGPPNPATGMPAYTWEHTSDRSYRGLLATYPSGGHSVYLSVNATDAASVVSELESGEWLDIATLAVFVDYTVYNADMNRLVHATLLMEQPASAGIVLSYKYTVVNLFPEADAEYHVLVLIHVVLFVILVVLIAVEVLDLLAARLAYLSSGWTIIDLALVGGLASYVSFYSALLSLTPTARAAAKANDGRYLDLSNVIYYERAATICMMIIAFALCLRFMRYATLHPRVSLYLYMMSGVFSSLLAFLVLYGCISLGFAFVAHLMFRDDVESYSTIARAIFANTGALLGDTEYDAWVKSNRYFAYVFFLTFSITLAIFMLNLIVSVLSDAFSQREAESRARVKATSAAVTHQLSRYWTVLTCGRARARVDAESTASSRSSGSDDDADDNDAQIPDDLRAQITDMAAQLSALQAQLAGVLAALPAHTHAPPAHPRAHAHAQRRAHGTRTSSTSSDVECDM